MSYMAEISSVNELSTAKGSMAHNTAVDYTIASKIDSVDYIRCRDITENLNV